MSLADDIDRIERERKAREAGLTLWFLALAERARRRVVSAIRVGAIWGGVLRGVLLGDERLDQPGGVPFLRRAMLETHRTGVRQVGKLVGEAVDDLADLPTIRQYEAAAMRQLEGVRGTLDEAITARLRDAATADRITADVGAVREAFRSTGWTPDSPRAAETEATAAVTRAYAGGMQQGVSQVAEVLSGLRFVNPLDANTTDICRVRAGIKLPLDHPWLFRNWPPLHYGCRSLMLPVTDRVKFTESLPTVPPPELGWGQWNGLLSAFTPRPS